MAKAEKILLPGIKVKPRIAPLERYQWAARVSVRNLESELPSLKELRSRLKKGEQVRSFVVGGTHEILVYPNLEQVEKKIAYNEQKIKMLKKEVL